jgi:invasion protein IalB
MIIARRALPATVALSLFSCVFSANAQDAPKAAAPQAKPPMEKSENPGKQRPPGWTVQCANRGASLECKANQTIVTAKTRQVLLAVSVSKPAGGQDLAMLVQLPHGLFNPAGVTVGVDGAVPETLQIQTCDAKGCYAGLAVTADKLAAMSKGTKLNVTFQDLKKQPITVPVSLNGLGEAVKKL